jgi:hypothetical protein
VYYSTNGGTNWLRLGTKMPNAVVSTLNFAVNTRVLYAATYGRSVYKIALPAAAVTNRYVSAENSRSNSVAALYPNPAKNYTILQLGENAKGTVVNIYNNNGLKLVSQKVAAKVSQQRIDLQKLSKGIYMIVCISNDKQTSYKLVIL